MDWLTWEPYKAFYDAVDVLGEYDVGLMDAHYMAIGRIPLFVSRSLST